VAKSIESIVAKRPVNRRLVDDHKKRMLDEARAYGLRELREGLDLTQVELADLLDVSQNRVSRLEKGDLERTQIDTLRRYVEALGGWLRVEVEIGGRTIRIG
jgi:predicted transcriptional regulator